MKNIVKKLLVTTAAFIVMSGSLGVGTLKVLAEQVEQYYGWNDIDSRKESPFFLYVTPVNEEKKRRDMVVYCYNKESHWPDNWEDVNVTYPNNLPLYKKVEGTDSVFSDYSTKFRETSLSKTSILVSLLSYGYPSSKSLQEKFGISDEQARVVTQLAIWYFTDRTPVEYLKDTGGYNLTNEQKRGLDFLIAKGESGEIPEGRQTYTLDIYQYQSGGYYGKNYQNLLGSTLVPKTPEEPKEPEQPQPSTPDINVEIIKPEIPTEPLVEPMLPLQPAIPITPKPEIPKEEDFETVIGGGNIVETTEDTATGSQGGAHNGVVSIQENKDPIVEETYDSPLPGQSGQSGSKTEVEDTKGPEVIIGGQGEVVDIEETLPTEQGQSGSTTEVEDTKGPDVMIGGQGQIVEFEETLSTEQGQSGSATEVEDTKGPDVLIGGQGEIVEFEETLPTEQGQSGFTTEVEDSKPKISIHFDNEWPKEEKPQLPAVEKPKAKVSLPATGEAEHVLSTIVGAMLLFLVSLWGLLKRKASKA
ncbi:thioester-forming surface-anchored protein [Streptococcus dysgalactiae]|uniref:thioester-forming surface-anchored protein n=1 Tax=Streptococcus dysgalactiae TaxID=1334 RepID=UPI003F7716CB